MRFSRVLPVVSAGAFLLFSQITVAAPSMAPDAQLPSETLKQPRLALLDSAIDVGLSLPLFSNKRLDSLKSEAARKGLVMMAAAEVSGKLSAHDAVAANQRAAERAIDELNLEFYTSLLIVASALMMWLGVNQRHRRI